MMQRDGDRFLIVGISGSGKTQLALRLAKKLHRSRRVIVFDPYLHNKNPPWDADLVTDSVEMIYRIATAKENRYRNFVFFVDEAGEFLERCREYDKLATQTRQFGHDIYFIAQRVTMLTPNIRNNCAKVYLFRQCESDCKIIAQEKAAPGLMAAATLPALSYLYLKDFDTITTHKITFEK